MLVQVRAKPGENTSFTFDDTADDTANFSCYQKV